MDAEKLFGEWVRGGQLTYNELLAVSKWLDYQWNTAFNHDDNKHMARMDNFMKLLATEMEDYYKDK